MDIKELEKKAISELRKLLQKDESEMVTLSEYPVKLLIQNTLRQEVFRDDIEDTRSYMKISKNGKNYRLYLGMVEKDYYFKPEIDLPTDLLIVLQKSVFITYKLLKKYVNTEICKLDYSLTFDGNFYLDDSVDERIGINLEPEESFT